jgi:hypothetical protein
VLIKGSGLDISPEKMTINELLGLRENQGWQYLKEKS